MCNRYDTKIYLDNFTIKLDKSRMCIRIKSNDDKISMTIFSKVNTMRYVSYTVSSLMGNLILNFGYKSSIHKYFDNILKFLPLLNE